MQRKHARAEPVERTDVPARRRVQFLSDLPDTANGDSGLQFRRTRCYSAIEIDNKQGNISTFEADEIIRKLSFKAFESEYKAVIIWLPERMNTQAANKLLKIIEEPWEKTLFLMVSESPERLLPTILSRMQVVDVPAIADERMAAWLAARKGLPTDDAAKVARLARGSILEASRVLEQRESSDEYFELFVRLMRLSYEDRHMELLEWAETVAALGLILGIVFVIIYALFK